VPAGDFLEFVIDPSIFALFLEEAGSEGNLVPLLILLGLKS
jgi:hypothetical protein